jgi:hypothetical protein
MEMLIEEDIAKAKALIVRIGAMLYKLTRSVDTPESFPPLPRRNGSKRSR